MSDLRQKLLTLRDELGKAHQLDPNDRAMLETVMSDIGRILHQHGTEPVGDEEHGDKLEGVAVKLEAGHPGVASAIRSVLDALGKAGI